MITLPLSTLAQHLGCSILNQDITFEGISIDSRTLKPGNLFVAVRGEQFDGHDFIATAIKQGASAIMSQTSINQPIPQLIVKDTLIALGKISELWRDQFTLPLIGVTGSNGKTTLKNMIASILQAACSKPYQVLATEGNLNNNIGVPLMLCRLNEMHSYGVIEMGMNHFGEIAYLTQLVKPQVAIINNAALAHLEGLKDVAGVAKAKGEIFQGLQKNGIAVLNRDDNFFDYWQKLSAEHIQLTFGLDHPADVSATIADSVITLNTPKGSITIDLPLLGRHNIMNALGATAVGLAANIELTAIKQGLESIKPAQGRMQQYNLANGARIIDDTYNANPSSLQAAVNTLATFPGKRIMVVGDMKELGADTKQLHYHAGEKIRDAGIDYLFTFGEMSAATSEAFGNTAQHFTDYEELALALQPYLKSETTILVKGSRSMRMENVIKKIIPQDQFANIH